MASVELRNFLENRELTAQVSGGVIILTGLWLLYRIYRPVPAHCSAQRLIDEQKLGKWGVLGIFAIGMVLSLNLCACSP